MNTERSFTQNSQNPQYPRYNNNPSVSPQPQNVPSTPNWMEKNEKNKPQSNSVAAAIFVFMSGGMNIAWSFGLITTIVLTIHMRISWFIGAIIGALVGAVLTNKLEKRRIMLFSSTMVILGGVLFISLSGYDAGIIAARYIDGIANGLIFPTILVLISEVSVKNLRGKVAVGIESMSISLGIYMQILYASIWAEANSEVAFSAAQMHGLLSIIYGVCAFLIAYYLVIESPIYYFVRGQEELALDTIRRLQRPSVITSETYEQFEEHKRYIAESKELTLAQSAVAGLAALLKMCFYRGMVALSFSMLTNYAMVISSTVSQGLYAIWPAVVFGTMRWLGTIISCFLVDSVGRKKPMIYWIIVCAVMAICVGWLFDRYSNVSNDSKMSIAMYLLFVYQFFAGLFVAVSSAYLSEAFPLAIKPYYIAVAFIVEMLVQIIICSTDLYDTNSMSDYFYAVGALSIIFWVFAMYFMPETKLTTLRQADSRFRKFLSTILN